MTDDELIARLQDYSLEPEANETWEAHLDVMRLAADRLETLRKALEPFAVEYDYVPDGVPDFQQFWESNLRIGDFRRAAQALASGAKDD